MTRLHERYIFAAIVLMAPVAAVEARARVPMIAISLVTGIDIAIVLLRELADRHLAVNFEPPLWLIRIGVVVMILATIRYAWVLRSMFSRPAAAWP